MQAVKRGSHRGLCPGRARAEGLDDAIVGQDLNRLPIREDVHSPQERRGASSTSWPTPKGSPNANGGEPETHDVCFMNHEARASATSSCARELPMRNEVGASPEWNDRAPSG